MSQTAVHLVDHVIPHVPVRQWVLSLPIPLRVRARHMQDAALLHADVGNGGAVMLIQRFGSAANLNFDPHCLVLDGVYRCEADGRPSFVEAGEPTDDELHALLSAQACSQALRAASSMAATAPISTSGRIIR
jgi:hypothetical protein